MLGIILYETVDLAYSISKVTYNGVRGLYYWYYGIEYPEQIEIEKREAVINELRKRIKHLEELQGLSTLTETVDDNSISSVKD